MRSWVPVVDAGCQYWMLGAGTGESEPAKAPAPSLRVIGQQGELRRLGWDVSLQPEAPLEGWKLLLWQ